MGHDDPKRPHHHHGGSHHEDDDLIAARPTRANETADAHATHSNVAATEADHSSAAPVERIELPHGAGTGRILHLDCFAGLAGDMIVGALLDLGVPRTPILRALETLPLTGFDVAAVDKIVSSIAATKFLVRVEGDQPYRTYRDIQAILREAKLSDGVRNRALETFRVLAIAEGKIHRISPEEVHFHEVGAVDAIVDIVASCAGFDWLGARVSCAPLPMPRGFARSEHGIIPVPAPAVVEILAGVPTVGVSLETEIVTPTGAALVKANVTEFTRWPSIKPIATGFGAGTKTLPDRPNLLRVVLGEPVAVESTIPTSDFATLETNLDDASGETIAHATEALRREGALDVWTTAISMKKGRPGVLISVLARAPDAHRLANVLMRESPTIGVRIRPCERVERPRRTISVQTDYGAVDVKVADGDGLPATAKPEDDAVQAIAREKNVPAKVVFAAAMGAFWAQK